LNDLIFSHLTFPIRREQVFCSLSVRKGGGGKGRGDLLTHASVSVEKKDFQQSAGDRGGIKSAWGGEGKIAVYPMAVRGNSENYGGRYPCWENGTQRQSDLGSQARGSCSPGWNACFAPCTLPAQLGAGACFADPWQSEASTCGVAE